MIATTEPSPDRNALVFGASGITGWAIIREAVQYPSSDAFHRIIGLTNRPLDESTSFLSHSDKILLASGIDLTTSARVVAEKLRVIDGIEDVTDVYFAAYVQPPNTSDVDGFEELKRVNVKILEIAVQAVEFVCLRLQFWSLQTGGKAYGFVHAAHLGPPKVPCRESDPRIPQPYANEVFYYAQNDALKRLSAGKAWTFAEIRPDGVIGFVPNGNNAMNIAQTLGIFLAFYAWREAKSTQTAAIRVPFPGNAATFTARHTEVGQRTLARAHLFSSSLALEPKISHFQKGEIYNVGDTSSSAGISWAEKWAALCGFFGLVGVSPGAIEGKELHAKDYVFQHQDEWETWEREHDLKDGIIKGATWDFMELILEMAVYDRQYDLNKLSETGFDEKQDIIEAYLDVFTSMKAAKMIP